MPFIVEEIVEEFEKVLEGKMIHVGGFEKLVGGFERYASCLPSLQCMRS